MSLRNVQEMSTLPGITLMVHVKIPQNMSAGRKAVLEDDPSTHLFPVVPMHPAKV